MNAKQVRKWLALKAPDYMLVGTKWLTELQDRTAIEEGLRTIVEAELAVTVEERDTALHERDTALRERDEARTIAETRLEPDAVDVAPWKIGEFPL